MSAANHTPKKAIDPRRIGRRFFGSVVLSAASFAATARGQAVTVQQVEVFENPPTNTHYAPVNFGGSATATSGSFPGITFHAQANTTDTQSGHAGTVGANFYGSGTAASPYVTDVYNQSAINFINGLNTQGSLGTSQPLPGGFGNGIRVSNHSYVTDFANATADENAIRRIDYIVNNEDVTFVAAAATGGTLANNNLVWASRNALSVRGDSVATPFDPSPAGGNTITAGKRRADVWHDQEASYATGRVSGYATGLIGQAMSLSLTDATHNQVVRSLIMTGADKSAVGITTGPWTRDTANNLSVTMGAGKANYNNSLSILQSGERTLQTVTGSNTPNVITSSTKGFAFGNSLAGQREAIVINAPDGISQLTATLNWNVTQQTTAGITLNTTDAGRVFADLSLELRTATLSGGQYILAASALPDTGLSSDATLDNVEHLFFNGAGGGLPPGTYAFVLGGDASFSVPVGFSYTFLPAPEPAAGFMLFPIVVLLRRRRARRAIPRVLD
jgi:hypothetical protein